MPDTARQPDPAEQLRERIRDELAHAGLQPVPIAVSLGKARDFLTDFLNGRKKKLDADFLGELAQRLGYASTDHFKRGQREGAENPAAADLAALKEANVVRLGSATPYTPMTAPVVPPMRDVTRRIPVVGDVEAGVWRETVARDAHDIDDYLALDVQGYEQADLKAYRVSGPSMNRVYVQGRFVVVAHPAQAGLRSGDHVVIERWRGSMTEVTLKEFVQEQDGRIALWPRSDHPDFQEPFHLKAQDEADQDGLTIIGVVVADYGRRDRPTIAYNPAGR
ncbi:LexA family protein [Caulobacter sp. DWR3-1-2]|uniref:LexA family protein n=1 Tax=Caulobacter sp. DWR3-1-2 TaxID=2804647 RepID=UPI003CE69960